MFDIQPPALAPTLSLELLTVARNPKREKSQKVTLKNRVRLKLWMAIVLGGGVLLSSFHLQAQSLVPHLINFQSVLTDPAGNPLSDGKHNVSFRFLDVEGKSLYQESQSLESQGGVVSAMVGSQNDLSIALLSPSSVKFLGVQVEGQGPETRMEIVSVPYAYYAEEALTVAPKSVGTESIKPKSITADLLADDVAQSLLPTTVVSISQLDAVKTDYLGGTGASKVGVNGSFVYSRGGNVQGVLKDMDTALYQRQVNLDQTKSELDKQVAALQSSIGAVNANIDGVQQSVSADQSKTQNNIDTLTSQANRTADEVSALQAAPHIVAWGIVKIDLSNGVPEMNGQNNIAGIRRFDGETYEITFTNPVTPPYVVMTNASVNVVSGIQTANTFQVTAQGNASAMNVPFSFTVIQ